MITEQLKIADLSLDPSNVRKHDRKNLDAIKASLRKFGQQKPIVVDAKGIVIAGNGTMTAAQELGWTEIAAYRTTLTGVEATAFAIADNRSAELAEWSDDLAGVLKSLADANVDLAELGFNQQDLAKISSELAGDAEIDAEAKIDKADELKEKWKTESGQLWILGDHRLLCGDSTKAEDISRLMNGDKADMWITDPPYNVAYIGKTKDALTIKNDSMIDSEFREFLKSSYHAADLNMKDGAVFYIWHADSEGFNFKGAAKDIGWKVRQCLIWLKSCLVMGRQDYQWKHEPCLYGWKEGASHYWGSDRKQTTVLEFNKPSRNAEHPTMKPVELFSYQIQNSSREGEIVLDSFAGSGTTLIACEQLNRKARLVELDPKYVAVILQRYFDATGKTPLIA
jgi:site-specific DNA-methyltransferase (adenine-specific)